MNITDLTATLFTYALTLESSFILQGLIISTVLGFSAGNYACSLVHRLPRGLGVLEKKPYCGSCQTMLATKDLFPVFSALLLNHKCRYCGAVIPKTHFYTELALGLLFCMCFAKFGFGEQYVLVILLGSMLTVLASIHHNSLLQPSSCDLIAGSTRTSDADIVDSVVEPQGDGLIDRRVLIAILVMGLLYRSITDGSLYPALEAGLYAALASALLWKKDIKKVGHIYVLPEHALIFVVGAMTVGIFGLLVYLPAYLALWALFKVVNKQLTYTLPFSLALTLALFLV